MAQSPEQCSFVLVVTSYQWSFSSCSLRSCHWAFESASFVHKLLTILVEDVDLPSIYNVRACLNVDVASLVVSPMKVEALRGQFRQYEECFTDPAVFVNHFLQVQNFLLEVVAEVLLVDGMREEVTFHLSVCCPALLLSSDVAVLTEEMSLFTGLLFDLNRVTAVERARMEQSFPSFLERFRSLATDVSVHDAGSAVELFRVCNSVSMRKLMRYLMCLNESPLLPVGAACVEVGQLSGDVTTSVCASILSFLKSQSVRTYESISGPLLEEVCESFGRLTVLSELTEEMLWDDVGVVAAEDYRQSLYELVGYTAEGERAPSPEI